MTICKLISLPPLQTEERFGQTRGIGRYVDCPSHGRGELPVFTIAEDVKLGDIVKLEVGADTRMERRRVDGVPKLPGQICPELPSRTVIRICKSRDHETAALELYCALEPGKSTFKSRKIRSTAPPPDAVKQWTFRANSATGAHWYDLHIYVMPVGTDPSLLEERN